MYIYIYTYDKRYNESRTLKKKRRQRSNGLLGLKDEADASWYFKQ